MAAALKDQFGAAVIERIADEVAAVHPAFDRQRFVTDAHDGFDALELMPRARHIARALRRALPEDFPQAIGILLASLGPHGPRREGEGMSAFRHLPHVLFVAEFGLEHFEAAMHAQHDLTRRFTAEFSIRAYLERHPKATLAVLERWVDDPDVHVRRLVSEGTRPRLPWAARLPAFQRDPRPVLALLERLRDDPEPYVRRSVANNLNDIGKDHPQLLIDTARRWLQDAPPARRAVVTHALRSLLKQGHAEALALTGIRPSDALVVTALRVDPDPAVIGASMKIHCTVYNRGPDAADVRADLHVHFVKASGARRAKVFRMPSLRLAPGAHGTVVRTIGLHQMSTRTHHPGEHRVEVAINGVVAARTTVQVLAACRRI
ncbi:MAG TPA: DNA alkylation repair protein [Quisquiliibacterium sp.]|nr:DNA alkylation repair protein [Quisquiliibacterium sp.]